MLHDSLDHQTFLEDDWFLCGEDLRLWFILNWVCCPIVFLWSEITSQICSPCSLLCHAPVLGKEKKIKSPNRRLWVSDRSGLIYLLLSSHAWAAPRTLQLLLEHWLWLSGRSISLLAKSSVSHGAELLILQNIYTQEMDQKPGLLPGCWSH